MKIIEEEKTIILSEILVICLERKPLKTCCPSEVARKLYPNNWREKMDLVRQCAQFLVEYSYIHITQQGIKVDSTSKGPIRLSWNND